MYALRHILLARLISLFLAEQKPTKEASLFRLLRLIAGKESKETAEKNVRFRYHVMRCAHLYAMIGANPESAGQVQHCSPDTRLAFAETAADKSGLDAALRLYARTEQEHRQRQQLAHFELAPAAVAGNFTSIS